MEFLERINFGFVYIIVKKIDSILIAEFCWHQIAASGHLRLIDRASMCRNRTCFGAANQSLQENKLRSLK